MTVSYKTPQHVANKTHCTSHGYTQHNNNYEVIRMSPNLDEGGQRKGSQGEGDLAEQHYQGGRRRRRRITEASLWPTVGNDGVRKDLPESMMTGVWRSLGCYTLGVCAACGSSLW